MPGNIGLPEIIVVLLIVLIIFGPKRLPELGHSLGKGIREFRGSLNGEHDDKPQSGSTTSAEATPLPPGEKVDATAQPVPDEQAAEKSETSTGS